MYGFSDVLVMAGLRPIDELNKRPMNWTEFEDRYGESREDFIETKDSEDESCSFCGFIFPSDLLTRIKDEKGITDRACPECLKEIKDASHED